MDDFEETDEASNEAEKKKKSGGKEGAGAASQTAVVVSQGFYERMGILGAPAHLIAEVLRNWRHLQGQGLLQRLIAFASSKSRASAHAEVEIKKGKEFGLVHNLLQHFKGLPRQPAQRHTLDHRNKFEP